MDTPCMDLFHAAPSMYGTIDSCVYIEDRNLSMARVLSLV